MLVQQTVVDAVGSGEISLPKTHTHNCLVASSISLWHSSRYKTLILTNSRVPYFRAGVRGADIHDRPEAF